MSCSSCSFDSHKHYPKLLNMLRVINANHNNAVFVMVANWLFSCCAHIYLYILKLSHLEPAAMQCNMPAMLGQLLSQHEHHPEIIESFMKITLNQ